MRDLQFFIARVTKRTTEFNEPLGECWLWNLGTDGTGRPVYCDRSEEKRNKNPAREIFKLVKLPTLPDGKEHPVLHKCIGQATCINPDHLYYLAVGGSKQNRSDAVVQKRIPPRKITENTTEIVRLFKEGIEQQEIAIRVGVSSATIMRFLNGQLNQYTHNYVKEASDARNDLIRKLYAEGKGITQICIEAKTTSGVVWSVVPEIKQRVGKVAESEKNVLIKNTLTKSERDKQIKELRASGVSARVIAEKFGISIPLVYQIK